MANNGCFDWDGVIENDGQEWVTIEGEYNFKVTNMERGRFRGSQKTPECNKATITLEVQTENGKGTCKADLILHTNFEWQLSSFFRSIGHKKKGEKLQMNWGAVVGSEGRAMFKPRTYTGNDGNEHTTNDVDYFIDFKAEDHPSIKEVDSLDGFISVPAGAPEEGLPFV